MWPVVGLMLVVVAGTIVAPVRVSTTWTVGPLSWAPFVGSTIVTTAGDDGRGPKLETMLAPGDVAGAVVGLAPPPQATEPSATRSRTDESPAKRGDRRFIGTSWLHGARRAGAGRGRRRRVDRELDLDRELLAGGRWSGHLRDVGAGLKVDVRDEVPRLQHARGQRRLRAARRADGHRHALDGQLRAVRIEERHVQLVVAGGPGVQVNLRGSTGRERFGEDRRQPRGGVLGHDRCRRWRRARRAAGRHGQGHLDRAGAVHDKGRHGPGAGDREVRAGPHEDARARSGWRQVERRRADVRPRGQVEAEAHLRGRDRLARVEIGRGRRERVEPGEPWRDREAEPNRRPEVVAADHERPDGRGRARARTSAATAAGLDRWRQVHERSGEQDHRCADAELAGSHQSEAPESTPGGRDADEVVERAEQRQDAEESCLDDDEMPEVGGQELVDRPDLLDGSHQARGGDDRDARGAHPREALHERCRPGARLAPGRHEQPGQAAQPHPDRRHVEPLDGDREDRQRSGGGMAGADVGEQRSGGSKPADREGRPDRARPDDERGDGSGRDDHGRRPLDDDGSEGRSERVRGRDAGFAQLNDDHGHSAHGGEQPGDRHQAPRVERRRAGDDRPEEGQAEEADQPDEEQPPGGDRGVRWPRGYGGPGAGADLARRRGLAADTECKRPRGVVAVDRGDGPPGDRVDARRQRVERDDQLIRVARRDCRRARCHRGPRRVEDPDRRQLGVGPLAEDDRDLGRRLGEARAGARIRGLRQGMRERRAGEDRQPDERDGRCGDSAAHALPRRGYAAPVRRRVATNRAATPTTIPTAPTRMPTWRAVLAWAWADAAAEAASLAAVWAAWAMAATSGPELAAGAADARASSRLTAVATSEIEGSFVGKSTELPSTTELNVESLAVAVSSTATPWIFPFRWNV